MLLILFVKYFTIGLTDSKIFYKQNQQHVTEILLYFCSKYLFDLFHCQVVCWRKVIDSSSSSLKEITESTSHYWTAEIFNVQMISKCRPMPHGTESSRYKLCLWAKMTAT